MVCPCDNSEKKHLVSSLADDVLILAKLPGAHQRGKQMVALKVIALIESLIKLTDLDILLLLVCA